jgi:hypothetical protein
MSGSADGSRKSFMRQGPFPSSRAFEVADERSRVQRGTMSPRDAREMTRHITRDTADAEFRRLVEEIERDE